MFDWKFIMIGIQTLTILANIVIFITIKLNDIKHISLNVNKIERKIDKIFRKLGKIEKKQIVRDTICNERHPEKKNR